MSADQTAPPKGIPRSYLVVLAAAVLVVLWVVGSSLLGPGTPRATTRPTATNTETAVAEVGLDAVTDLFRKSADLDSCRNAVQLLNAHLARHADKKSAPLKDPERSRLQKELALDDEELDEISSSAFTPLDAYHLEQCFLLREAAQALNLDGLSERDRATAAFAWVMRQVRLRNDAPQVLLPPALVLRRGWGNAIERIFVFLELLRQLDLPGFLVVVPGEGGLRPWAAGVLVGSDVYLFDTRLGVPIPGPGGRGIATLSQVRNQPELLNALGVDANHPYDVTREQAVGAELRVAWPMSFLSARMRWLQDAVGVNLQVRLSADPKSLTDRLQQEVAGRTVRVWTGPKAADVPTRSLRVSMPPEDGRKGDRYLEHYLSKLVPWTAYPAAFKGLPGDANASRLLQSIFARPFAEIYFSPRALAEKNFAGRALQAQHDIDDSVAAVGPRELMLRGLHAEALAKLETTLDQAEALTQLVAVDPDLVNRAERWVDTARPVLTQLQEATRAAQQNPDARDRLPQAQAQVEALERPLGAAYAGLAEMQDARHVLRKTTDPEVRAEVRERLEQAQAFVDRCKGSTEPILLVQAAAAQLVIPQALYLRALCKQEQAEAAQTVLDKTPNAPAADVTLVRDAWTAADDAWQRYLDRAGVEAAEPEALLNRSRVLERLGRRDAAALLLDDLPRQLRAGGPLASWNAAAWLFRAQQLKSR